MYSTQIQTLLQKKLSGSSGYIKETDTDSLATILYRPDWQPEAELAIHDLVKLICVSMASKYVEIMSGFVATYRVHYWGLI